MPMFDFKCGDCGETTEKIVSSATPAIECPACGGKAVKQLAAPGDFTCKGKGFYKAGANFKTTTN